MNDCSVLIGGRAGDGIDKAGSILAAILNRLNYRLYIYRDYPSIIRGGHTFSIIRAAKEKKATHLDSIDFLLALNQDTVDLHRNRLKAKAILIYNSDLIKQETIPSAWKALGLALEKMVKEESGLDIMRNSCMIGVFCKAAGIEWNVLEDAFRANISKEIDLNLKIARKGYDAAEELVKIETLSQEALPIVTGNEAIGLGLAKGGLDTYIAYPMTPSSPILHFLAGLAEDFGLKVIHPESEIAVMLMALGFSYMGEKVAVGTSGGGFCLMTEGLSLSGMAELPVVVIVGQRPGPSTGLPTYSSQTELHFVLNAGQGEFVRFVVAPGDPEEAFYWSQIALNLAVKYQIPSIILSDKTLGEGAYSFDMDSVKKAKAEGPLMWDRIGQYKRYLDTAAGISPQAFVPDEDAIVKINSYEHDEIGITTEDPKIAKMMQDKRLRKEKFLSEELEDYECVALHGNQDSKTALLCWGSNKGVVIEAAEKFNLKVMQVLTMSPFPVKQFQDAVKGVDRIISIENNATAQLVALINRYGFTADKKILKYDGRPFSLDELEGELRKVIG